MGESESSSELFGQIDVEDQFKVHAAIGEHCIAPHPIRPGRFLRSCLLPEVPNHRRGRNNGTERLDHGHGRRQVRCGHETGVALLFLGNYILVTELFT